VPVYQIVALNCVELNLLKTLLVVDVKCVLYLVSDRYLGNRGSLSDIPALTILVTKTLKYPTSLGHFLQTVSDWGSEDSSLKNDLEWFSWK